MTAIDGANRTLLGLADIAALAGVQRAVVSVWRRRSSDGEYPFPTPVAVQDGRERFSLDDIVSWLEVTGRGNNGHVREDGALYAALELDLPPQTVVEGITALLALKATAGIELAGRSMIDLLDEADDVDPYDECLYREIERLGEHAPAVAAHADAMASAAYHAAAALDRVLGGQIAGAGTARTAVQPAVHDLMARMTAELAAGPEMPVVDPTGSGTGTVALRASADELAPSTIGLPRGDDPALRTTRRHLLAHGWWPVDTTGDDGRLVLPPGAVVVGHYPAPRDVRMTDEDILQAIDEIALAMDDSHTGVIVGPSSALVERPATPAVDRARDAVLRTHRVRAAVRLPAGLRPAHPRERLALWVLGPPQTDVPIADRWMVLADVNVPLAEAAVEDLVTDVVTAVRAGAAARVHAFRFARLVRTSRVIAADGDLLDVAAPRIPVERGAGGRLVASIERVAEQVGAPLPGVHLDVTVAARDGRPARMVTLGQLVRDGAVRMISGNRVDPADLMTDGDVVALGPEQVRGGAPEFLDRLAFSSRYPAGRYTEPGDIVLTTTGQPAAMVDDAGLSVAIFPARVLRFDPDAEPGLLRELVVRAIRNAPAGAPWKSWPIPLVPQETAPALARELERIAAAREAARIRAAALDDLIDDLSDGVIAGTLALTPRERG